MNPIVTVAALLEDGARHLRAAGAGRQGPDTARLDARVLLAQVLGVSRARLESHPEEAPTLETAERYLRLIERRAAGEPVAYLTGRREFWSLTLTVSPAVLIPR
ncbi:MAG: hypothetical protein WAK94_07340, partial [Steroidobacteraceae bacterium]